MPAAQWLERYAAEMPNIERAFSFALQHSELHQRAIAIALHTAWYWHESGRTDEGRSMLERALSLQSNVRERAELHRMLGMYQFSRGNYARAIEHAQHALESGLEIEPAEPLHRYYTLYANALLYAGRYDEAEQYYRMALDSAQGWNKTADVSTCRFNLAILMYECKGEFANARRLLSSSFEVKSIDEFDDALVHETLARIAFLERNYSEAVSHADAAIELLERIGNQEHLLDVVMRQCVYTMLDGDGDRARALWGRHGEQALSSNNPETCAAAMDASAILSTGRGDLARAVAMRALLKRFRNEHHLVVFPVEQRLYDAWEFAAHAILGKDEYRRAAAIGETLHVQDAAR